MKEQTPENNFHNGLDASFQNGQSDTEKLMREHLQTPGHIITDEDLKNIKKTPESAASDNVILESDSLNNEETEDDVPEHDKPATPWDVLGQ